MLAIMFSIFTACMFADQYEGMTTNTTGIEAMKGWAEQKVCSNYYSYIVCAGFQTALFS